MHTIGERCRFKLAYKMLTLTVPMVAAMTLVSIPCKAEVELGEFCWQWDPFIDTLRLTVSQAESTTNQSWSLHGRERAMGFYQIEVSGHASENIMSPGNIALSVSGAHGTSLFGNNQGCFFFANLNPTTLSGPLTVTCPGPTTFMNTGTLNPIPCADPAGPVKEGRAGGQ